MTGDDLKRMQDGFLEGAKAILRKHGKLHMVGFVVTLHKHVEKLFDNGWGVEFLDPKECVRDAKDDSVAAIVVNLALDWKRMYHAVLNVFPKTRGVLPQMLALGEMVKVDDPYKRVMRPFLNHTGMDEKDVVAATMRHICDKVEAFASIFQSEAWLRTATAEERDQIPESLADDEKSVEVVISSMETREFVRMLTVPIEREPARSSKKAKKRDGGKVVGFGDLVECLDAMDGTDHLEGRMVRFLKPLGTSP